MFRPMLILSFTVLAFACAPKKKFSGDAAQGSIEKEKPEPAPLPSPSPPAAAPVTCDTPGVKLETITQEINFPERTTACAFGVAPNIEAKQEIVTASESQSVDLTLPKGTICSMNVSSNQDTKLLYDDFIILTLDNHILFASNRGINLYMERKGGILDWDFNNLVNKPVGNWDAQAFCLGKSAVVDETGNVTDPGDCQLPPTEKAGPFKMDLSGSTIAPIALAIQGKTSVPMKLIVTGDNDPDKDCHHTELDLKATIKYLPK